jgi:hypothetical protein
MTSVDGLIGKRLAVVLHESFSSMSNLCCFCPDCGSGSTKRWSSSKSHKALSKES